MASSSRPSPPPPPPQQRAGLPPKSPSSPAAYSLFSGRIPAPLQRLFDRFPLATYPPNDLPARCPVPAETTLPTLHVFISERDAAAGRPSFNPTCLKWQTFLKIAGVNLHLVPSTNHASPTGALPFLLPSAARPPPALKTGPGAPAGKDPAPTCTSPAPIPAHKLQAYALAHGTTPPSPPPQQRSLPQQQQAHDSAGEKGGERGAGRGPAGVEAAYAALVDHAVRRAWLHALYLSPANAPLVSCLYLEPASRHPLVRATLRSQLRAAAAAELAAARNGIDPPSAAELYADARAALASLAQLLTGTSRGADEAGDADGDGETEAPSSSSSSSGWFFGAKGPGMFDAAVFAYTHLLLPGSGLEWADRDLCEAVEAFPALVDHRARMLARLWDDGRGPGQVGEQGPGQSR